jgi:hypothetical protein
MHVNNIDLPPVKRTAALPVRLGAPVNGVDMIRLGRGWQDYRL